MNPQLLQRLSINEAQQHTDQLELAIESHARWLGKTNLALLFNPPADPRDLAEEPHRHCQFGRWYDNVDDPVLKGLPEFQALGDVHANLHLLARALLIAKSSGTSLPRTTYEELLEHSEQMRTLVTRLHTMFRENLDLVARLMGKVFENATEGVIITGPDGTIITVNHAFSKTTGYSVDEAVGRTPNLLYSGRHGRDFYHSMWRSLEQNGHWQGEIWNRRKDGALYLEWLTIAAVHDDKGRVVNYVGVFADVTRERESEQHLYRLAHYDTLTGLPNRMLFQDLVRQALKHAHRNGDLVGLMFLDLDGFKPVNDTYGHHIGDLLLKQVGDRLNTCLRTSDAVGRFGGDEFTIVARDATLQGIHVLANKVVNLIGNPFIIDGTTHRVTVSLGISLYPRDGRNPDLLLRRADIAMYHAKSHGKNGYKLFSPDME